MAIRLCEAISPAHYLTLLSPRLANSRICSHKMIPRHLTAILLEIFTNFAIEMEMLDEIFIPNNNIKFDDELDYSRVDEYIYSTKAFSHATY